MKNIIKKEQQETLKTIFDSIALNFPFNNKSEKAKFKKSFEYYKNRILKSNEDIKDIDFYNLIEEFLAKLKNTHTYLFSYPGRKFYFPKNYHVIKLNDKYYLFNSKKNIGQIIKIDDNDPNEILTKIKKNIPSKNIQYKTHRALKFILANIKSKPVNILLNRNNKVKTLKLKRESVKNDKKFDDLFKAKILNKKIGYLKIDSFLNTYKDDYIKFVNNKINLFNNAKISGMIIDLRNNFGGNSYLADYLATKIIQKKTFFGSAKQRTPEDKIKYKFKKFYISPGNTSLNVPIVILSDINCISSCEYFIAGLKDNKIAKVIGEKTAGGSGNPIMVNIPYRESSLDILIATWQYYRPNKQKLEGVGIKPDITIKLNLNEHEKNKDIFLEKAVKTIKALTI